MTVFVDTNVLVYARDASERDKQPIAARWVRSLWESGEGRLSVQVLQEYYMTTTRKLRPGLATEDARSDVRDLLSWRPVQMDGALVEAGWAIEDRFGLSFWDSLIVAAAHDAGCDSLLSEDLSSGMDLDGLVVVNPFEAEPPL